MKKTLPLLACLFFTAVIGCKKSSENSTPAISIVGKWYEVKAVLTQSTNGGTPVTTTSTSTDRDSYVIFNSDGTGTNVDSGTTSTFTYKLSGSSLTLTPNEDNGTLTVQSVTSTSFIIHEVFSGKQGNHQISGTLDDYLSK